MNVLRVSAPAKLNLHLQVLARRTDGFHDLWTLFQTIDLTDELTFEHSTDGCVSLAVEPPGSVDTGAGNLVFQAATALRSLSGEVRGVAIRLRKRIPVGAGLGGGSSDAATTLIALDRFWGLHLSAEELSVVAAGLGSDVPFFLSGGLALGSGRGDVIRQLPDLGHHGVVVAAPRFGISTEKAFAVLTDQLTSRGPDATVEAFVEAHGADSGSKPPWRSLVNDFEPVVTEEWPEIGRVVGAVRNTHPLHASVTGTGAAAFGIFDDLEAAQRAGREIGNDWLVHVGSTLGRRQARQMRCHCE